MATRLGKFVSEVEEGMNARELRWWSWLLAEEATESGLSEDQREARRELARMRLEDPGG